MDPTRLHPFVDSGYATWDGGKRICQCGMVQNARIHQLPETPPEAREIDSRRIGEAAA